MARNKESRAVGSKQEVEGSVTNLLLCRFASLHLERCNRMWFSRAKIEIHPFTAAENQAFEPASEEYDFCVRSK